ncbi:MAG: UvrB/UvrC motif-containing protein [Bacteroidota bacterium]
MKFNRILAIAINEYDNPQLNNLQNCKSDIESILGALTNKYAFEDIDFIFEKKDTTRQALYNKIRSYFSDRLDDENVLLLFAGHGEYDEKLETAYWQPSDANPADLSTWFNLNDLLTFIKASEAFHIGIISDSCFSGAMFQAPYRGGGIEAINSKKSRIGLSSGSLEKVSDGKEGELSPFATILIKELADNTATELLFNVLATNIILKFDDQRKQTPMHGPLFNVGHEGGSFVFKIKEDEAETIDNDENAFLKDKFKNLFIPVSEKHLKLIEDIKPLRELKNTAVKKQNYMEAARLRDEEKEVERQIVDDAWVYIPLFFKDLKFSEQQIKAAEELDDKISKTTKSAPDQIKAYQNMIEQMEKEITDKGQKATKEEVKRLRSFSYNIFEFLSIGDPAGDFFNQERENFLRYYQGNILDLYRSLFLIKATSSSKFLEEKLGQLLLIMTQIYKLEISYLNRGFYNNLDETIALKEHDMQVLKWIKND